MKFHGLVAVAETLGGRVRCGLRRYLRVRVMPVTRFTGCTVRLSNRRGGRRWQVDGGWRQLTRVWEQHALRCAHEGGHVFAFQHLGQKMSTHSGSTWKRPSGGSRRQKSGWGSCLFGRTRASSLGRFRQPAAATTSREAFRLGASLKYVEEAYTKARGGGRAAGPHLRELLNGAKQNVQTEPNLPVGGQEIGQKKLLVGATTSTTNRRHLQVKASVTGPRSATRGRCVVKVPSFGSSDRARHAVLEHGEETYGKFKAPFLREVVFGTSLLQAVPHLPGCQDIGRVSGRERSWQGTLRQPSLFLSISRVRSRALRRGSVPAEWSRGFIRELWAGRKRGPRAMAGT